MPIITNALKKGQCKRSVNDSVPVKIIFGLGVAQLFCKEVDT